MRGAPAFDSGVSAAHPARAGVAGRGRLGDPDTVVWSSLVAEWIVCLTGPCGGSKTR